MTPAGMPQERPSPYVAPAATEPRDPAASMALLDQVLDPPVGPGYFSAAQRRVAAGLSPSSGTRTWTMLLTMIGLGFLLVVSATTLRAPDPAAAEGRRELIARIEAGQEVGDQERARVEQLRAEIVALEGAAGGDPQLAEDLSRAGRQAGASAVTGPGVVVTLEDEPGEEVTGEETPERVTSRDLQVVVNGLWGAGAEAVAVNDHRMTSTSAIRFAGEALVVDFRALTPPYVVTAIGDPARLEAETSAGVTGAYLAELRKLDLRTDARGRDDLVIGAAERLTTRVATVPTQEEETP